MTVRRRSPRRLDRFAGRSSLHAVGVQLHRALLVFGFALIVGYALIAASPMLGQLIADAMATDR